MSSYYDGMTRTEQVDSWFARLTAWLREVCGPRVVPPVPPPFVWDMLRAEARRLDAGDRVVDVLRSTSGLAGQPPAPIDQLDAHDSAATMAAVALLKNVAASLEGDVAMFSPVWPSIDELRGLKSNVRRALELLGVKP